MEEPAVLGQSRLSNCKREKGVWAKKVENPCLHGLDGLTLTRLGMDTDDSCPVVSRDSPRDKKHECLVSCLQTLRTGRLLKVGRRQTCVGDQLPSPDKCAQHVYPLPSSPGQLGYRLDVASSVIDMTQRDSTAVTHLTVPRLPLSRTPRILSAQCRAEHHGGVNRLHYDGTTVSHRPRPSS